MSMQRMIGRSLAFGFALSLTGVAFARQPPAIQQLRNTTAAEIGGAPLRGAGYRDIDARYPTQARNYGWERRVGVAGGYRDLKVRFQ